MRQVTIGCKRYKILALLYPILTWRLYDKWLMARYWRENLLHKWNLIFNVGRYFYEVYSNETNHHNKI